VRAQRRRLKVMMWYLVIDIRFIISRTETSLTGMLGGQAVRCKYEKRTLVGTYDKVTLLSYLFANIFSNPIR
jgi:hypothetical protein